MTHRITMALVVAFMLSTPVPDARAASFAKVKRIISKKLAAHRTIQYKSTTTGDTRLGPTAVKSSRTRHVQLLKQKNGKVLGRFEVKEKIVMTLRGNTNRTDVNMIYVDDGDFFFMYDVDRKTCTKNIHEMRSIEQGHPFDFDRYYARYAPHHDFKVLDSVKIDGRPTYVIEWKPRRHVRKSKDSKERSVLYYDTKTGIMLKSESYDQTGRIERTILVTDVKIDEDIGPERFKLDLTGVRFIDETQLTIGR